MAEQLAKSHVLIQARPTDRLDYIQKTAAIKQVIVGCVSYLDQLGNDPNIISYTEEELKIIHEAVCVSAIPLLNMIENFLDAAKEEERGYSFAV